MMPSITIRSIMEDLRAENEALREVVERKNMPKRSFRGRSMLLFRWAGRLERLAHWLRGGRACWADPGECPCSDAGEEYAKQTVGEWWDPADRP